MTKDSLLLRYLEEKPFVDQFMQGHIRLNALGFFWGEHDEPTKEGQIDSLEGLVCGIDAKSREDCMRADGYKYCNILCCYRLDFISEGDTIGWYTSEYMDKFGDYVVIIKDKDAFQKRLVKAASKQGFKCGCSSVDYSDRYTHDRDCFDKEAGYSYQKEWRTALYRGTDVCEPYDLYIGPIDDIAEWCLTSRLNKTLERIFREHDFAPSSEKYYGNIDRFDLVKLFAS